MRFWRRRRCRCELGRVPTAAEIRARIGRVGLDDLITSDWGERVADSLTIISLKQRINDESCRLHQLLADHGERHDALVQRVDEVVVRVERRLRFQEVAEGLAVAVGLVQVVQGLLKLVVHRRIVGVR